MQKGMRYAIAMIRREAGEIVESHYGCLLTDIERPVAQFEWAEGR